MRKMIIALLFYLSVILLYSDFIAPGELRPGMTGYCLTVFKGDKPDTFNVKLIDIIENYNGGRTVLLVECMGENVEETGIAQGMSGSPVYFNGKLAGSLSYTWSNMKKPIGAVTPIDDMLKLKTFEQQMNGEIYRFKSIEAPIIIDGVSRGIIESVRDRDINSMLDNAESGISGSSPRSRNAPETGPGHAVAIKLIDGDMQVSAIGTCTYTDGNDLYMLGHALYTKGRINYPVSPAYVYSVIPRSDMSFKLGIAYDSNIGAGMQDRNTGVYARRSREADMIPVAVNLAGEKIEMRFVRDEDIIMTMLPLMYIGAIGRRIKSSGPLTAGYIMKIVTENSGTIQYRNTVSSETALMEIYTDLQSILYAYLKNIFKAPQIIRIEIESDIYEDIRRLSVSDILIEKKYYYPGETIDGHIIFSEFRGGRHKEPFTLPIPSNLSSDSLRIIAVNGRNEMVFELNRNEGKYSFTNLETLMSIIDSLNPSNAVIVKLIEIKKGAADMNREYSNLPGTAVRSMINTGSREINTDIVSEQTILTNGVITGEQSVTVKLRRKHD
ncbi:MAG: SpoIVB peptidase S55 domain-containing protein [bacterium]